MNDTKKEDWQDELAVATASLFKRVAELQLEYNALSSTVHKNSQTIRALLADDELFLAKMEHVTDEIEMISAQLSVILEKFNGRLTPEQVKKFGAVREEIRKTLHGESAAA